MTPIVLHDNPRSNNAQKVRLLLGELGLDYERREVPFGEQRPAWHLALNPTGGIPALRDGPVELAESGAILRYLTTREGRDDLYPTALVERARVDWLLDAVGMTLRPIGRTLDGPAFGWRPRRGIGAEPVDHAALAAALPAAHGPLERFALLLGDPPWACLGRYTIADIAAAPVLNRLRHAGALEDQQRLAAWADAVHARPAWAAIAAESGLPTRDARTP